MQSYDVSKLIDEICELYLNLRDLQIELVEEIKRTKKHWYLIGVWISVYVFDKQKEAVESMMSMLKGIYVNVCLLRARMTLAKKKVYNYYVKRGFSFDRILKHENMMKDLVNSDAVM